MGLWYTPTPVPYRPHRATWRQPLHLHLAPLWDALVPRLGALRGRVLDVGCGQRPYRALLGEAVESYVGLDREGTLPAPDVVGDAEGLPFPDGAFDAAVSFQVLEHVPSPWRAVEELSRVVKPCGTVLFTVPGVWPAHELPHDYWRFTEEGLRALGLRAGLGSLEVVPLGGLWATLGQMANLELDRRRPTRCLVPLVNLAARALEPTASHTLVLNWLVTGERRA
ncbi:MAG: class I SAM-dependent methyltransferase [Deltaproteobacteria bacterium]|nr:class I SAM-dependent methyltransferase [Deltaproteobacteria bacterium]